MTFLEPDKQTKEERQAMAKALGLDDDFFEPEADEEEGLQSR